MKRQAVAMGTMVVLLIAGLVAAEETEDKAIAAIAKLEGRIKRDENKPGRPVVALDLTRTEVIDAGLKNLAALKQLKTLDLGGTKVTDAGLKDLATLKQLQVLDLASTKVTDAGVKELAKALPGCQFER